MIHEYCHYPVELHLRDNGGDGRTLVGPLLPWGVPARVVDQGRHVIETFERGALAGTDPARVPRTATHPRDAGTLPIGVTVALEERADAAWGAWRVSDTALGNEVLALARDGVPLGLSIGFLEVPAGRAGRPTAAASPGPGRRWTTSPWSGCPPTPEPACRAYGPPTAQRAPVRWPPWPAAGGSYGEQEPHQRGCARAARPAVWAAITRSSTATAARPASSGYANASAASHDDPGPCMPGLRAARARQQPLLGLRAHPRPGPRHAPGAQLHRPARPAPRPPGRRARPVGALPTLRHALGPDPALLDLMHNDDRTAWLGLGHRRCNRVANAVLREDSRGARLAKEHKDSKRRIDAAVDAVMAHDRAAVLAGDRGPSIYV